jgi:ABC-type Fe3+/spermidine/putrescine transport system ATPase subunit
MNEMVKFLDVRKQFRKVSALSGARFSIPDGSVTAMPGANGAGKSTALKMMVGLEKPTSGNAVVLGKDSRKIGPEELRRIGYVAEGMELPDWMTVKELMDWCRPMYPEWDRKLERKLEDDDGGFGYGGWLDLPGGCFWLSRPLSALGEFFRDLAEPAKLGCACHDGRDSLRWLVGREAVVDFAADVLRGSGGDVGVGGLSLG